MKDERLSRRDFLEKAATVGAVTFGVSLIAACQPNKAGGEEPKAGGGDAKAADCTDVSALSDADKATRTSLKYEDKSTDPAKNCANCSLFQPGSPCGGCAVVKVPIAAEGNCTAWAPKA